MLIDIQIPAHLRQQVAADFFLAILEGGEFCAEVQAAMATLTSIGHELAGDLLAPGQLLDSPLEFRTLHKFHSRTYLSARQGGATGGDRRPMTGGKKRSSVPPTEANSAEPLAR